MRIRTVLAITGGRRGGKTYELMQWLKQDENHRQVIVHSLEYAKHLREEYDIKEERLSNPQKIVSWHSIMNGTNRGHPQREVAVDNVDFLISEVLHSPVELVTFTGAAKTPQELKVMRDSSSS